MISKFFGNSENMSELAEFRTEWARKVAKWVKEDTVGQDAEGQGARIGYKSNRGDLTSGCVGMATIESED